MTCWQGRRDKGRGKGQGRGRSEDGRGRARGFVRSFVRPFDSLLRWKSGGKRASSEKVSCAVVVVEREAKKREEQESNERMRDRSLELRCVLPLSFKLRRSLTAIRGRVRPFLSQVEEVRMGEVVWYWRLREVRKRGGSLELDDLLPLLTFVRLEGLLRRGEEG